MSLIDLMIYVCIAVLIFGAGWKGGRAVAKRPSEAEMFERLVALRRARKTEEVTGKNLEEEIESAAERMVPAAKAD